MSLANESKPGISAGSVDLLRIGYACYSLMKSLLKLLRFFTKS